LDRHLLAQIGVTWDLERTLKRKFEAVITKQNSGSFFTVDDSVAAGASDFDKSQQLSTSGAQRIQYQSVKDNNFNRIQQSLESGSGPGVGGFKSSFPDHSKSSKKIFDVCPFCVGGIEGGCLYPCPAL
jgi:hypothetical protein